MKQAIKNTAKKMLCVFNFKKRCPKKPLFKRVTNSDLFIIEFPKSGITWFSTILVNIALIKTGQSLRVTHFNIEQFVGDVHVSRDVRTILQYPGYRIIKSHEAYRREYRHVIYLVRNPISVMNSYYHFALSNGLYCGSFARFIRSKKFGIEIWNSHVTSWLSPIAPLKLHLIRYEDLMDFPNKTISNLLLNIGWCVSEEIISDALSKSCFSEMKNDNNLYKLNNPARKYDFVREGKKETIIDKQDKAYILEVTREIGSLVYPELYDEEMLNKIGI